MLKSKEWYGTKQENVEKLYATLTKIRNSDVPGEELSSAQVANLYEMVASYARNLKTIYRGNHKGRTKTN